MDGLIKVDEQWVPLQVKVFSRWVSSQLQGHSNIQIDDITKDLSNGVALCDLATILTKKDAPRAWAHDPKRAVDMVQNCELAVDMFEKDGVKLIGISGKDINDNNTKLILGLIWSLILRYQISQSISPDMTTENKENTQEGSASAVSAKNQKEALLSWAAKRTANYPHIHNFQPFDLSLCALLDTYVPDKINYYSLDPADSHHNSELATNVMHDLGIPVFVYPDELAKHENKVDEKTLLTQLSTFKIVVDQRPEPEVKNETEVPVETEVQVETEVPEEKEVQVDNDNDDNDGENPDWVIDDENGDANVAVGEKLGSSTNDSLIDLSVVPEDPPNMKNGVSILASNAEWVTNDGIDNQPLGRRMESGDNLIEFSGDSEEQVDADSKLVDNVNDDDQPSWIANNNFAAQERNISLNQQNEEDNSNKVEEDESSGNYDDAVLIWENPNIDVGTGTPAWVIDDPGDAAPIVPDHLAWVFEGDAPVNELGPNVLEWVISDEAAAAPAPADEQVLDWIVDENAPKDDAAVADGGPVEPEWVVQSKMTHRGFTDPKIQRWEINDAQEEAIKMRSAEENLEQQILARQMSYHDVNEHGLPEDNDESADYSAHHMFLVKKSWF